MFRTTATNEHGKKEEIGVSAVFVDTRRRVFALCTVRQEGVSKWSSPPEVCSAARLLCTDAVKEITGPKAPPVALELQIVREYMSGNGLKIRQLPHNPDKVEMRCFISTMVEMKPDEMKLLWSK